MPERPAVSIIIPVYNEEQMLAGVACDLINALQGLDLIFEVILAENGSKDASARIADELARTDPRIRAIHLPFPDYGQAVRQGYLAASQDFLANFSVDWIDINFLQIALSKLDQFDIVLGSKSIGEDSDQRPSIRRFGGIWFHGLVRILFGLRVSDTHGIKVLRRDKVLTLVEQSRFGQEIFDTELIVRAQRAGLAISEVPVIVEEKRPSRVSVLTRARRAALQLAKLRVILWQERLV